ncbi:YkgJ family cysteine cluster protein [Pseudodesulfovibrio thermohalotolerans]|uniref:YkgJ family cysteine cluster protein n=1 Tax=Pseudodesulfovibrio thermohalotolerans TaxID=2880651 RepID=UPI0022B9FAAC|nr:YkgJ family cysteine cluster protein [Pseudodesulfovibrio thermohalotolerans]WFS62236.1 YkgJ family cysteine cluster protein [Pseudodesulfovibrio thermohalotolerans]
MALTDRLTGLFRRFRSFVLRREVEVVGHCLCCGRCCRSIRLSEEGRWLRHVSEFERLVIEAPGLGRFVPLKRDEQGFLTFDCTMLGEDNLCIRHGSRLSLCRNYPSKSLYYQGGRTLKGCGYSYRAVTFRDVLLGRKPLKPSDFSAALRREIEQEQDNRK